MTERTLKPEEKLKMILRMFVDEPEKVDVELCDFKTIAVYKVRCSDIDRGYIIGRSANTVKALQEIARLFTGKPVRIEIEDNKGGLNESK
jgi:predicted RNA-binding protein YlqC (UPF0109 family)